MSHTSRLRDIQVSHVRATLEYEPGHEIGEYLVQVSREVHKLLFRFIPVIRQEVVFLERVKTEAQATEIFEHASDVFL